MHYSKLLTRAGLLILTLVGSSYADDRYIARIDPGKVDAASRQYGFKVEKQLKSDGLYRILASSAAVQSMTSNGVVQTVEQDRNLGLPEITSAWSDKTSHKTPGLKKWKNAITLPGQSPWTPYVTQPAIGALRLDEAQKKYGYGSGAVTVAVIDTAVDANHPILQPVVDVGRAYDAISGTATLAQETSPFIDQETSPFIDGAGTIVLNQETSPFIDQETSPFIDNHLPAGFGHGTMVAGIIHLVAPYARIMPIRAFSPDGSGQMSDVIEGIYWAVNHGATVINMSASAGESSPELQAAIDYAASKGVVFVSSVANENSPAIVYPAGINPVAGVASVNYNKVKSSFSNYGSDVDVAATGEAIMTTFPQGHWALGWGTSFATPFVTGTVALMKSLNPSLTIQGVTAALQDGAAHVDSPGLGAGQLDIFKSAVMALSRDK